MRQKYEGKKILDTPMCEIFEDTANNEYRVYITSSRGAVIEHEPFPKNVMGLVAALTLATEVCAGKFFLRGVVDYDGVSPKIERQMLPESSQNLFRKSGRSE